MTDIKNKNKFLKISSIFLIGVFAVFLAFMPFFMNNNKDKVMADSVVSGSNISFYSSSTIVPVNLVNKDNFNASLVDHSPLYLDLAFVLRNFNIGDDSVTPSLFFGTTGYSGQNFAMTRDSYYMAFDSSNSNWYKARITSSFLLSRDTWVRIGLFPSAYLYNDYRILVEYHLDNLFNFNVVRCVIRSVSNGILGLYAGVILTLYDDNNYAFQLNFPLSSNNLSSWGLMYDYSKDYYLIDTNDLTDNQFYLQGKDDGLSQGRAEGDAQGYQRGLDEGYAAGERYGYNEGLVAGADVSFLNLVGATVDAPVKAFNGLFDFTIDLGGSSFNLKSFLIALLTIALIIAFVRLIMAK